MWNKQQDCRAEKELRYSIRKYKFGAASVAIAALMFLGARVASADSVVENTSHSTTGVVNPENKAESPEGVTEPTENKTDEVNKISENKALTNNANSAPTVDKAKLRKVVEELNSLLSTKLNLDDLVVSPVKDRLQKGKEALENSELAQKDIDELAELLSKDVTVVSAAAKEATEVQVDKKVDKQVDKTEKPVENLVNQSSPEVSASEESQAVSAKKDALKVSVDQLQATVLEVPEHETSKEVLEKANELLGLAQGVLENTTVSLNDVEEMTKRVKRMFNSVKNATTRLTSGVRDSRNGQRIPQGTQFRAYTPISSSGALKNVKYYASVDPKDNGGQGTRNNDPEFTEKKTVIKAKYEQNSSGKWMVYDVYFNNNGVAMVEQSYGQHYYFQPPFNIMDPSNTVRDLTITRYQNVDGNPNRKLSDGGSGFQKFGETITITDPWNQKDKIFAGDRRSMYDPRSGVTRENQKPQVFKNNATDSDLNKIVRKTDGNYTGGVSYTLGMEVGKVNTPLAVHMTARVKLKDNVTEQEAANGNVYAASVTSGPTTKQSYIVGSLGTTLKPNDTTPPTITANGATVTKNEKIVDIPVTAVDNTDGVGMRDNNPIEVTGLPQGLTYTNGKITGTPTGPVGNSTVTIKAYDKNGNKAEKTITITVKDQASKYNPTGETLTVNQGQTILDDAVKAKVKNYAPGSLTVVSKPSTAKPGNVGNAVVKVTYPDGSTENVNVPVTVLEAPDNQPPTLAISPANQTVVEGEKVTFTVTAKDNKVVTIDGKDFTTKYGNRLLSGKATNTNVKITDTEKVTTITITTTAEDVGKTNTITFNASDNAGNKAKPVTFTFNVTSRDTIPPTITAGDATVTSREQITPISVTSVDNPGGVGLRDNNPIEVSGLPAGLTYANNQITGTPTGTPGNSTVTIKAYDKNGNMATKTITITVRSQADVHNPTGETLTVPYNHNITDDEVKAKVQNFAPGTLTVQSKPSTNTSGNVGNAVVKVTYPDGSHDTVNVPVVVGRPNKDDYTPQYNDGSGKPGSSVEIPVVEANGKKIPTGTTYTSGTPGIITVDETTGKVTVTIPSDKNPGDKVTGKVLVRYPDGSTEEVPVTVTVVNRDKDDYTPKYEDGNGKPGAKVEIPLTEETGKKIPSGTTFESDKPGVITVDKDGKVTVTIPEGAKPGDKITGKVTVTYPDGSKEEVPVTVTVTDQDKDIYTPKYEDGNGKPGTKVEIPLTEETGKKIPSGTTFESDKPGVITVDKDGKVTITIPEGAKPGDKITGKVTVTYPDGSKEEVPVTVTVTDQDKDIYTPKYEDGNGKPGTKVEIPLTEETGKKIPSGTTFESDKPGVITVDKDGKVTITIPEGAKPGDKITGKVTVTYPDGSKEEVPVTVTVTDQDKDIYTPKYEDGNGKPGAKVEIPLTEETGKKIPSGTTFESDQPGVITVDKDGKVTVTIPEGAKPGDKITGKVTVTYPDGSKEEVPVTVTVTDQDKDIYTPKYEDGNGKPGAKVEIPLTEETGKKIPSGTTFESDKPGVITVDKDGKVTVTIPEGAKPGDKITGKVTVTYPDGSKEEVPVTVTVTDQDKDIYTPKYEDGNGKPGAKVEIPLTEETGKKIPSGTTFESDQPGVITVDKDGKVTVTIPEGAKPGDKITGKVTVTYPDGSKEEVPVTVTVTDQDKDIYTPKYEDGNGKPGAKVEIPLTEETGKKIPSGTKFESNTPGITVDKDGKVTVTIPEGAKPGDKITGKVTVTYPDGSKEEVPVTVTVTDQDKDIYTPKYEDGNGKPGAKVEIPLTEETGKKIPSGTTFESDQPGVITVDQDGKVTVTIPEGAKPGDKITGKVTVTYPDGSKEEVPVTVTVTDQDKDIYTPKYEDGNGKPGAKVEIPLTEETGKKIPSGTTFESDQPGVITVDKDGKVTVTIPEGAKPGDKITGKVTVTYPDGSKEEVPVTVTVTDQDKDIYTPKYEDGNGKPGAKVEIPLTEETGKKIPSGTTFESDQPGVITVDKDGKVTVTIPEGAKPGDKITGKVTVTYPDGSKEEVPVTVTVTDQDKDIYTPKYEDGNGKPGAKVEIPVKPDTNGGSGQDTPAPATPTPNAVTPNADQVDTKTTVDNGAKSNDSQDVLPNTGTESNATLASLGLLGLLSGFGLVARKKKKTKNLVK